MKIWKENQRKIHRNPIRRLILTSIRIMISIQFLCIPLSPTFIVTNPVGGCRQHPRPGHSSGHPHRLLLRLDAFPLLSFYSPESPMQYKELLHFPQVRHVFVSNSTSGKGRGGGAQEEQEITMGKDVKHGFGLSTTVDMDSLPPNVKGITGSM